LRDRVEYRHARVGEQEASAMYASSADAGERLSTR
jgi:hypothetical protein